MCRLLWIVLCLTITISFKISSFSSAAPLNPIKWRITPKSGPSIEPNDENIWSSLMKPKTKKDSRLSSNMYDDYVPRLPTESNTFGSYRKKDQESPVADDFYLRNLIEESSNVFSMNGLFNDNESDIARAKRERNSIKKWSFRKSEKSDLEDEWR